MQKPRRLTARFYHRAKAAKPILLFTDSLLEPLPSSPPHDEGHLQQWAERLSCLCMEDGTERRSSPYT